MSTSNSREENSHLKGGGGGELCLQTVLKVRELTFLRLHAQVGSDKVGREEPITSVVKPFPPVRVADGTVTKHQSPSRSSSSKHMQPNQPFHPHTQTLLYMAVCEMFKSIRLLLYMPLSSIHLITTNTDRPHTQILL